MKRCAAPLLFGALLGAALSLSWRPAAADEKNPAKPAPVTYEYGRLKVTDLQNDDGEFLRTSAWHWRDGRGDIGTATGGELLKKLGGPDKQVSRSVDILNHLGSQGWRLVSIHRERGASKEKHVHAVEYSYTLSRP
jgi:hypothetical protein